MRNTGIIKNYNQFLELKKGVSNIQKPPHTEEYDLYEDIMKDEKIRKQTNDNLYK